MSEPTTDTTVLANDELTLSAKKLTLASDLQVNGRLISSNYTTINGTRTIPEDAPGQLYVDTVNAARDVNAGRNINLEGTLHITPDAKIKGYNFKEDKLVPITLETTQMIVKGDTLVEGSLNAEKGTSSEGLILTKCGGTPNLEVGDVVYKHLSGGVFKWSQLGIISQIFGVVLKKLDNDFCVIATQGEVLCNVTGPVNQDTWLMTDFTNPGFAIAYNNSSDVDIVGIALETVAAGSPGLVKVWLQVNGLIRRGGTNTSFASPTPK